MLKKLLNLQLFATTEVDLKSDATTTYAGVKSIDDAHAYFDRALKDAIYDEYTFEKYADVITLPQNNGKTMTLRKLTKYDANINELKEGVVPPEDAPMGINEFSVKLGDYGGYTTYTDQVDIYALNNGVAARIQRNQGNSVGEKFQLKVRDIMYSSPNRWFAGVTSVPATLEDAREATGPFKLDDLRKIRTALKRMRVKPFDGTNYLFLISPEVEQTLYSLAKSDTEFTFIELQNYRANSLNPLPGEIGTWLNFRFIVEDSLGEIKDAEGNAYVGDNSNPIHGCVILGKFRGEKGMKLVKLAGYGEPKTIVKPIDAGGAKENPLNQIGSVGWKLMGWGGTILYAEAVMVYECESDIDVVTPFEDTAREAFTAGVTGARGVDGASVSAEASTKKTIKNGKAGVVFTDDTDNDMQIDPVEEVEGD